MFVSVVVKFIICIWILLGFEAVGIASEFDPGLDQDHFAINDNCGVEPNWEAIGEKVDFV